MKKDIIDVTLNVEPSYPSNLDAKVEVRCRGELVNDLIKIPKTHKPIKTVEQAILNALFENNKVERVIMNPPATILFWDDGEKTVVKCHECGDGKCIFDKDFGMPTLDANTVALDDLSQLDETVTKIARCDFCQMHYDEEKAVMAAMLKRLYPNFQNVLRDAFEGGEQ